MIHIAARSVLSIVDSVQRADQTAGVRAAHLTDADAWAPGTGEAGYDATYRLKVKAGQR
jgi:hypothetical protein